MACSTQSIFLTQVDTAPGSEKDHCFKKVSNN